MVLPQRRRGGAIILFSFLTALYLMVLPMPDWAIPYRPPWAALVLIYWSLALPQRYGVFTGWILGLTLDAMSGAMLGENALTLAVIGYICQSIYNRMRVFPFWQQALVVLAMLLLQHLIDYWIRSSFDQTPGTMLFWVSPVIGAVIWPWLYVVLRDVRRRFHVA